MAGRIRSIAGHTQQPLTAGWELASSPPDLPNDRAAAELAWMPIDKAGTVAAALRDAGRWSLDGPARRFDAADWWYRVGFGHDSSTTAARTMLCMGGLATVAEAWLNGQPLLHSDNMFVAHEIGADELLRPENELVLRFRSLDAQLATRRPRPRWRAPMIENQQLRWLRTTLLGRTPGWSAPAAPVGPWQPVWLERRRFVEIEELRLDASLVDGSGLVTVSCRIRELPGTTVRTAELRVEHDGQVLQAALIGGQEAGRYQAALRVPYPRLWWPHTHGTPSLHQASLSIGIESAASAERSLSVNLGRIGFRKVTLDARDDGFRIAINDAPIFCRGACWTPLDPVTLTASATEYRHAIAQARDAGMNMLRVGGTMVYEADDFLDECDALGVMLWQDFMFANMDYPQDATFGESVQREARQQLSRLGGRPALTILCGNSEVEQQAAMWGAARELWSPRLFHELLPALSRECCSGVPYWPSSAHGGAFPHQNNAGTTSYYGVGAYLRPLEDARRSDVRFATEALAFANVPEDPCIARMPGGLGLRVHHSAWKARTPRDLGAGWDFEDVRDHYLRTLFAVDPLQLRYADHDRYVEMSRVVTGEVMHAAFGEWRRRGALCGGALVWFLRDLWPGAGWGLIDATGAPKAAYYFVRRALQPQAIFISDEGCNGLMLHVANDRADPLAAEVSVEFYRGERRVFGKPVTRLDIPPHQTIELAAAAMYEGFHDLSYAYKFGPQPYDVAVATLRATGSDSILARAYHLPGGPGAVSQVDPGLSATAMRLPDGAFQLELRTRRMAQAIAVRIDGFACEDQYFHLPPDSARLMTLRPVSATQPFRGTVSALNSPAPVAIELRD